jgi:uncharacterized membrane protein YbhN (UPF0104 family)
MLSIPHAGVAGPLPGTAVARPTARVLHGVREFAAELAPARGSLDRRSGPLARLATVATGLAAAALMAVLVLRGHVFLAAVARALHANWSLVGVGALLEAASVGGYVILLHRVVSAASPRLHLRDSYDITLAGTAATRVLPTAGLGGAAVTVWALRSHGVRMRELSERLIAFLVLLYSVYMAALVACGGAVASGLVHVPSGQPVAFAAVSLGVGIPLAIGAVAWASALLAPAARLVGGDRARLASVAERLERQAPLLRGALRRGLGELRAAHPALLGALAWWGFDIAVLLAMLHAFGATPAVPVLILAYFMGTLFNLLPLPGSLSGGLAGMLVAFGLPAAPAIAAVLAYRAVAVWLPAAAGVPAVGRLRSSVAQWRAGIRETTSRETTPSPAALAR